MKNMTENEGTSGTTAHRRLLNTGARLLGSGNGEVLRNCFNASRLSRAANLSRGSFYDNFPTTADYVATLNTHLSAIRADEYVQSDTTGLDAMGGDLRAAVTLLTRGFIEHRRVGEPARGAVIGGLLAPQPKGQKLTTAWDQLVRDLDKIGQRPREPFTIDDVSTAMSAAVDGFTLSYTDANESVLVAVLLNVLLTMTAAGGAESEYSETEILERRVASSWRDHATEQPLINVQRLVLQVAAEEIAANGFNRLNLSVLRHRTGLSEITIGKYVGSIRNIADALLAERYPGLAIALESDLSKSMPPDVVLMAHVVRMVKLCRARREFAETELAIRGLKSREGVASPAQLVIDELLTAVVSLLRGGSHENSEPFVGVVQQLSCALARELPDRSAEDCAQMVLAMVTSGKVDQ